MPRTRWCGTHLILVACNTAAVGKVLAQCGPVRRERITIKPRHQLQQQRHTMLAAYRNERKNKYIEIEKIPMSKRQNKNRTKKTTAHTFILKSTTVYKQRG